MSNWASHSLGNEDSDPQVDVTFVGGPMDGQHERMEWPVRGITTTLLESGVHIAGKKYYRQSKHFYSGSHPQDWRRKVLRWKGVVDRSFLAGRPNGETGGTQ